MRKLFDFDGGLMDLFAKASDLVILNLIFILTCIPIVTIGPALTALYSVTLKMTRNEESYAFKSYISAFKENFKISILAWLIILAALTVFLTDYRISIFWANSMGKVMSIIALTMMFMCFVVSLMLFPYIARFENTLKLSFKSAIFMAIASLPSTLLLIVITGLLGAFVAFLIPRPYAILGGIIVAFSLLAFIQSFILKKIFAKYEDEIEEQQ